MNIPAARPQGIALVTCSYQQGLYIEATLRSVLEQDYPALEYAVVDGGSTDGTPAILAGYRGRCAHVLIEPDRGQTDALVKGFTLTRGPIMGWLCSDDLLLRGALSTVDRYFREHPEIDAVYGDALWIDAAGRLLRPKKEIAFNRFVFLHDHNYIPQPAMFWRRRLYERVGGLDPDFDLAMDGDLWERFSRAGRIAHLPRYLAAMRYYPAQKTRRGRARGRREDAAIRRRSGVGRFPWVRIPCHAAARTLRVCTKALSGGYGAYVPAVHLEWLDRLRVPEGVP